MFDRAIINCEFLTSSFATNERKERPRESKQSKEVIHLLKQTFEASVQTELFPYSEININVHVIQSDGAVLACAVNAVSLALCNAGTFVFVFNTSVFVRKQGNTRTGVPMKELIVASSAGFTEVTPFLDLNSTERSGSGSLLTVAIEPNTKKIALVRVCA